jgi:hypothetical protein
MRLCMSTIRRGPLKIRVCARAKDCLNLALKAGFHILQTCVYSYSRVHMQASVATEARKDVSKADSEGLGRWCVTLGITGVLDFVHLPVS